MVNPKWWDAKNPTIKARIVCRDEDRQELDDSLASIRQFLSDKYYRDKIHSAVGKKWLANALVSYALWQAEKNLGSTNDTKVLASLPKQEKKEIPYEIFFLNMTECS